MASRRAGGLAQFGFAPAWLGRLTAPSRAGGITKGRDSGGIFPDWDRRRTAEILTLDTWNAVTATGIV